MSAPVMQSFIVVVTVGNILALLAGIALLLAPRQTIKSLRAGGAPTSLRRLTKPLETFLDLEGPLLRYSRVLGIALLAGSLFVLIRWSLFIVEVKDVAAAAFVFAQLFPGVAWHAPLWEVLWVALSAMILLGSLLGIFVGVLALARSSMLKRMSKFGNRWVSTRRATRSVSKPYYGVDKWIAANPQAWGGAIAALSLFTLAMIVWFTR